MYPESCENLNKETAEAIYFFTPAFHVFDNFSAHQVKIWYKTFPTAEHAYQWKKFAGSHPLIAEDILTAGSPEAAQKIAHENKTKILTSWHEQKTAVMEEILRAKAEQHQDVKQALNRSGKRIIIENSPVDSFWGIGPKGDGQNWVGKIWMKIRESYA